MTSGECPVCGERYGLGTWCDCPLPGEHCDGCARPLDECRCGPLCDDDWSDREERRREREEP